MREGSGKIIMEAKPEAEKPGVEGRVAGRVVSGLELETRDLRRKDRRH